jgi:hypothetical protein
VTPADELVELAKKRAKASLKYAKAFYDPRTATYKVKLVLERPMPFDQLAELAAAAAAKGFSVEVYAPHAKAIRLDLRKKG